jgi:hypothetical protein
VKKQSGGPTHLFGRASQTRRVSLFLELFPMLALVVLFSFFRFTRSKVVRATTATFSKAVAKRPLALVAFSRKNSGPGKRISSVLDSLSLNYSSAIEMITVDMDADSNLLGSTQVGFGPTIAVFVRGQLRTLFTADWATNTLAPFCDMLTNEEIPELNDSFSVFEFQHKSPVNLLLTDEALLPAAQKMQSVFAGLLRIAIVRNPNLINALNYSKAVLTKPSEMLTINLKTINDTIIQSLLTTKVQYLSSSEFFGVSPALETAIALVDERDPLMIFETMVRFRALEQEFGKRIAFQICDSFNALQVLQQFRVGHYDGPLFLRHSKAGNRYSMEPYPKFAQKADDLVQWFRMQISGIKPTPDKPVQGVPRLTAYDFIPNVLDPKLDVILLVASPRMPHYEEGIETLRILIDLFKDIPQIKCYEFNPLTQHVTGLELPKSEEPQFSIWPASAEPNGGAFSAQVGLKATLSAIFQIIKTPVTESQMKDIQEKLGQMTGSSE